MIQGYVHINFDEAFLADVEIINKKEISSLDNYVGYMELVNGENVVVYNVNGILKGYIE